MIILNDFLIVCSKLSLDNLISMISQVNLVIGPDTGPITLAAKGGRIGSKHGGKVTGAAKRGFGRALMKGKK